jgi:hypothetical protein
MVISDGVKKQLLDLLEAVQFGKRTASLRQLSVLVQKSEFRLDEYPEIPLLSVLRSLLDTVAVISSIEDIAEIISCLCNLSLLSGNVLEIVSAKHNFLPYFAGYLNGLSLKSFRKEDGENIITLIETLFSNCSLVVESHSILFSSQYVHYLRRMLDKKPNRTRYYMLLSNLVVNMRNDHIPEIIELGFPGLLLEKLLSYGSDVKTGEDHGIIDRTIACVMSISSSSSGSEYLKDYFILHPKDSVFFHDLLPSPNILGIRATIIMANIYGKDENNSVTSALLESYPSTLSLLVDIIDSTMNYDTNRSSVRETLRRGFKFGSPVLSRPTGALRNLAVSDVNKKIMIACPKLLVLACQGIKLFVDNAEECKGKRVGNDFYDNGGGGGKDYDTLINFTELLIQLSFYYEKDSVLQSSFVVPSYDMKLLLESLIHLPAERNVPLEVVQWSQQLINRLTKNKTPISEVVPVQPQKSHQHIMLSYCWADKSRVLLVCKKLRELGYDIWRDEEGSSILGPISGDIISSMSRAVDNSHTVIIFVSPKYKESANCRSEASYAHMRQNTTGLKLIYVMMNESYTTVSKPRSVDGWLGFIVSSSLWYPFWDPEIQYSSLIKALTGMIGNSNNIRLLSDHSEITTVALPSSVPLSNNNNLVLVHETLLFTPYEQPNYEVAFSWLEPKKSYCRGTWPTLLMELGIEEAKDLDNMDRIRLMGLAGLLKIKPAENFLHALKFTCSWYQTKNEELSEGKKLR